MKYQCNWRMELAWHDFTNWCMFSSCNQGQTPDGTLHISPFVP
jgi:hypothetical protein